MIMITDNRDTIRPSKQVQLTLDNIYSEAEKNGLNISKLPLDIIMQQIHTVLQDEPQLVFEEVLSRFLYEVYNEGFVEAPETIDYDIEQKMNIPLDEMEQIFFRITEDDFYQVLKNKDLKVEPELSHDVELLVDDLLNHMKKQRKDWVEEIVELLDQQLDEYS